MDLVDDAVTAHADAVAGRLSGHVDAAGWARRFGGKVDRSLDAPLFGSRQRRDGLHGSTCDVHLVTVAHTNPRSALTSSHGT